MTKPLSLCIGYKVSIYFINFLTAEDELIRLNTVFACNCSNASHRHNKKNRQRRENFLQNGI